MKPISPENLLPNLFFVFLVHEPRVDDDKDNPRCYISIVKGDPLSHLGMSKLKGAFSSKRKAVVYANIQRHIQRNWDKRRIKVDGLDNGPLKIYK